MEIRPESSREIILSRIHAAVADDCDAESIDRAWSAIPRSYCRSSDAPAGSILGRLSDRLKDYDAGVRYASETEIAATVATMLRAREARTLLVPPGFPEHLLPVGFEYVQDQALVAADLEACDGVITLCTLAIAETGTIVLQNAPGQGRRAASLIPDYHLCLIDSAQVLATVPEAIAALQPTATLPTTFISGPSATADIEMTRIKGVHGPRFLDVILIVPASV